MKIMEKFLFKIHIIFFIILLVFETLSAQGYYVIINFDTKQELDFTSNLIVEQEIEGREKIFITGNEIYLGPYEYRDALDKKEKLYSKLNLECIINVDYEICLLNDGFELTFDTTTSKNELLNFQNDIKIRKIISKAIDLYNIKYKYGGENLENGIDCSYFVKYIFETEGINLPRTAREQFKIGEEVSFDQMKCGDLVFFKKQNKSQKNSKKNKKEFFIINHVGIYLKDGYFIHAARKSKKVTISSLNEEYYKNHFAGAKRVSLFKSYLN